MRSRWPGSESVMKGLLGKPRDSWVEIIGCEDSLSEIQDCIASLEDEVEQCEVNVEAFADEDDIDEYERDLYENQEVLSMWEGRLIDRTREIEEAK